MAGTVRLVWNRSFSVGSETIDVQHETLLKLIQRLADKVSRDVVDPLFWKQSLRFVYLYTRTHLQYEETLLKFVKYPALEQHLAQHQELRGRINDFLKLTDPTRKNAAKVLKTLNGWWVQHIKQEDKKYARHIAHLGI